MTDKQLARKHEAWRKLALVKEEINKGATVRQALSNTHMSAGFYYTYRDMAEPGKEQAVTSPARKAMSAHTPAKPSPSPLNYCPHCGMNLRAVNIALNMNHE